MPRSAVFSGIATLGIGTLGGLCFFWLNLPLPWILGSLSATALISLTTEFRPVLPAGWRNVAHIIIGTMLGAGFTPEVISGAANWAISILAMLLLSAAFFAVNYWAFRRLGRMDRTTALFAAMPGGMAVMTLLAEEYGADAGKVALSHISRVMVLLITAPFVIQAISGIDVADANQAAFTNAESIIPRQHGILALAAVLSWFVARRVPLPSAMLLVPLFISAALHMTGTIYAHVPPHLSNLAQIAVGASVGTRFGGYRLLDIVRHGWMGAVVAVFMAAGALLAALILAPLLGYGSAALYISYLPGGAPELSVVALALMIQPAMVAAHHVIRIFAIVLALPLAARIVKRQDRQGADG